MVPFYLTNKTKKRIELLFSLFTKEEYECLTNKETIDIKASMLEISEALKAKYFFNWTAKRKYKKEIESCKREKLFLKDKKDRKIFAKRCLLDIFFEFNNSNITVNDALEIISKEWDNFKDKNQLWKNYSSKEIVLLLKTKLNKGCKPLTDNKKVFRHEFKEYLESLTYTQPRVIDLCTEITERIFIRYFHKPKKHSLSAEKVLEGIKGVFTDEENNFLRNENGEGIIDYFLSFDSCLTPVYTSVEESKLALEKALTVIRKDNWIVFSNSKTVLNFYWFVMYALFYLE